MSLLADLRIRANALKADSYALYLVARDPRTPWYAKVLAATVVAYAVSPIDLIPDFIPVLGYLDDLILLPLGIALAIRLVPTDVLADCRARAAERSDAGQRVSFLAGAVIVVIWVVMGALLIAWGYRVLRARPG
jgi:uncharacterized membrane protein YkvA (DUF1232 family)